MKAAIAKAILVLATLAASVTAFAQAERENPAPRLTTNEVEIVEALRPGALAIDDPVAVFAYVLGQLPIACRSIRPRIITTFVSSTAE